MALDRTVLMEDGSVRSHHEIERLTHICGDATIVDVLSWADASKGGDPMRTIVRHAYDSGLTESLAYELVADMPEFAEYVDPDREAIDALIPTLTDEQAELVPTIFGEWTTGVAYSAGDRVRYGGRLYRCVQAHTSQADWAPDVATSLWVRTSADEWAEWVQPTGAHDAYNEGDKVSHSEKHWTSDIDGNVWEPGVYGWTETPE